jgi:hypothetical protein
MTGYAIVGIPGWEQLRLGEADRAQTERRIDELARQTVPEDVPRDRATPFREETRRHLLRLADQGRQAGAVIVCLPTSRMGDIAVPASYTVSEWSDGQPLMAEPADVVELLADRSDVSASVVEVDGQPALREEGVEYPDEAAAELVTRPARRVTYTIADPVVTGTWIVVVFSTLGDGDPEGDLAAVLVELFDAHIATLRWSIPTAADLREAAADHPRNDTDTKEQVMTNEAGGPGA